jgi:hypothetical protein
LSSVMPMILRRVSKAGGSRAFSRSVSRTSGEVRSGIACGKDAADRVRAVGRTKSEASWGGEARNLQYHAVPGNMSQLSIFRHRLCRLWREVLSHRSQRAELNWQRLNLLLERWIPFPRVPASLSAGSLCPRHIRSKGRIRQRARTDLCRGATSDGRPYRDNGSPAHLARFTPEPRKCVQNSPHRRNRAQPSSGMRPSKTR